MIRRVIRRTALGGTQKYFIGMAHRGRLNVLINVLGKKPSDLFEEFEGKAIVDTSGDVKYHQGFSSNVMTPPRTREPKFVPLDNPMYSLM